MARITIKDGLVAQEAEMSRFRSVVRSSEVTAYNKVCQQYSDLVRSLYRMPPPEPESHVFLSHIEAILKFTKP
jgi:hypothetical protein